MNKTILKSISIAVFASIVLLSCTDKEAKISSNKIIEDKNKQEMQVVKKDEPKLDASMYEAVMSATFRDVAKIGPMGKKMILVFGTSLDPYTTKLKKDINDNELLAKKLKTEFTSYYFKADRNLRHKQFHNGEFMDVDTNTMVNIYAIESTPTIIFTDENAKAILVVPGYMPADQFIVTMDFMNEGLYKGKDRKNGDVYEALRDYYEKNGINVRKKD